MKQASLIVIIGSETSFPAIFRMLAFWDLNMGRNGMETRFIQTWKNVGRNFSAVLSETVVIEANSSCAQRE